MLKQWIGSAALFAVALSLGALAGCHEERRREVVVVDHGPRPVVVERQPVVVEQRPVVVERRRPVVVVEKKHHPDVVVVEKKPRHHDVVVVEKKHPKKVVVVKEDKHGHVEEIKVKKKH